MCGGHSVPQRKWFGMEKKMRLGINGDLGHKNPEEWISLIRRFGVRAAVAPMKREDPADVKGEYLRLAQKEDIVIGEVGIWKNVLDADEKKSAEAISYAQEQLAFADEIGARCCVNVSGAAGPVWDGYYPENYSAETYERIVDVTRKIIDAVKPVRTFFTLEPMYWMHPDSPDDYLQLLKDIDRERFGVHMDYTNMMNGFEKYHNCEAFIRECFSKLGPYIKSIHAKDVILKNKPPVCINEVLPGKGRVDFRLVFRLADQLDEDMPVFAEHLSSLEEYEQALVYMKKVEKEMD